MQKGITMAKAKAGLRAYSSMLKVGSMEFKDKLMAYLTENGYRKSNTYRFTIKELEEITGIKEVWWGNWKRQAIPGHALVLLHLNFDIDLKELFATGELKKISKGGRNGKCA